MEAVIVLTQGLCIAAAYFILFRMVITKRWIAAVAVILASLMIILAHRFSFGPEIWTSYFWLSGTASTLALISFMLRRRGVALVIGGIAGLPIGALVLDFVGVGGARQILPLDHIISVIALLLTPLTLILAFVFLSGATFERSRGVAIGTQ